MKRQMINMKMAKDIICGILMVCSILGALTSIAQNPAQISLILPNVPACESSTFNIQISMVNGQGGTNRFGELTQFDLQISEDGNNFNTLSQFTLTSGSLPQPVDFASRVTTRSVTLPTGSGTRYLRIKTQSPTLTSLLSILTLVSSSSSSSNSGTDRTICFGSESPMSANAPAASNTGTWSILSGSANTNILQFLDIHSPTSIFHPIAVGTYTLRWTVSNPYCNVSAIDDVVITCVAVANAGSDQSTCVNTPINLAANTATVGSTGSWSVIANANTPTIFVFNNGSASTSTNTTATFNTTVPGTYTLRWTISSSGCISTDDVMVTVLNKDQSNTGTDQYICLGNQNTLTANTPSDDSQGTWSIVSGPNTSTSQFNNTHAANAGFTPTLTGTYTLRWTIINTMNGTCGASTDDVVIICIPIANAGSDFHICPGSFASMSANAPANGTVGTWDIRGGSDLNISQLSNIHDPLAIFTPSGPGLFILRWTINSSGCTSISDVAVNVRAPIAPNAGADDTICFEGYFLHGNDVGIGNWYVVSSPIGSTYRLDGSDQSTKAFYTDLAGTYVVRYTSVYGTCDTLHDDVVLTVVDRARGGTDRDVCLGNNIPMAASIPDEGSTGTWQIISGPDDITIQFNNVHDPHAIFTPTAAGQYQFRWIVTTNNGNCFHLDIVNANVALSPIAGPDKYVCIGNSTNLEGNHPQGSPSEWIIVSGPNTNNNQLENKSIYNTRFTPTTKGIYLLEWKFNNSCASDTVKIEVTDPPTANAGNDQCARWGGLVPLIRLNGNVPPNGMTGIWSIVSGSGEFVNGDPQNPQARFSIYFDGITTLVWTIGNGSCVSTDTMYYTYLDGGTNSAGTNDTSCVNTFIPLFATQRYFTMIGTWSVINGPAGSNAVFSNIHDRLATFKADVAGSYLLKWASSAANFGNCNAADAFVTITVTNPVAFAGDDRCVTNSPSLSNNALQAGETGIWEILSQPATGNNSINYIPSNNTYTLIAQGDGEYRLKWTVTNSHGCVASDIVIINKISQVSAGFDQVICAGTLTTNMNAANPTIGFGHWEIVAKPNNANVVFGDLNSAQSAVTVDIPGLYRFKWIIEYTENTCSTEDQIAISFEQKANAGADQELCNNSPATLNAILPHPHTGQWTVISGQGGSFQNNTVPNTVFNGSANQTYLLKWTVQNVSNIACINSDTVRIVFSNALISAGADQSLCFANGISVSLNATQPGGYTGVWSKIGGPIRLHLFSNNNSPTSSFTPASAGDFLLEWSASNNYCTIKDTVSIKLNNQITTVNAGPDQATFAEGVPGNYQSIFTMNADPMSSGQGHWEVYSIDDEAVGIIIIGQHGVFPPNITIESPNSPTTRVIIGNNSHNPFNINYTLKWSPDNDPCGSTAYDYVDLRIATGFTILGGNNQTVCFASQNSVTLQATAFDGGIQGTWSKYSGIGIVFFSDVHDPHSSFTTVTSGDYVLRWKGIGANGAYREAFVSIHFLENCQFQWDSTAWSACNVTCGGGTQTRTINCLDQDGNIVAGNLCDINTKPSISQSCNTQPCPTYSWSAGAWGTCNATCGGGTQTRTVNCLDQDGIIVTGSLCDINSKPIVSQACNTQPCPTYSWSAGAWGTCTVNCGGGTQARIVNCLDQNGNIVAGSHCDINTKPSISQSCNTQPCPTYSWAAGAWGSCTVTCGGGTQSRTVTCLDQNGNIVAGSLCDINTKPIVSQACNTQPCPNYSWSIGSWSGCSVTCGAGIQTRTVVCRDQNGNLVDDFNCSGAGTKPAILQHCISGTISSYYRDVDGDGYGNPTLKKDTCALPSGYVINSQDCNDGNGNVKPGATEICNGIDDNCNGQIDEGINIPLPQASTIHPDCNNGGKGTITITNMITGDMVSFDNGATYQSSNTKSNLIPNIYRIIIKKSNGCVSSAISVVLNALSPISASINNLQLEYSKSDPSIILKGTPSGGIFKIDGIILPGGLFVPAIYSSGTHTVTYAVTQGVCTATVTKTITIKALNDPLVIGQCYMIKEYTIFNNGGVITANGNSDQVILSSSNGSLSQIWILESSSNGYYKWRNSKTGKHLKRLNIKDIGQGTGNTTASDWQLNLNNSLDNYQLINRAASLFLTATSTGKFQLSPIDRFGGRQNYVFIKQSCAGSIASLESRSYNLPEISLFPNPTDGLLHIRSNDLLIHTRYHLSVINMMGEILWQAEKSSDELHSIDLRSTGLRDGMYILRIKDQLHTIDKKFVIKR